MSGHFYKLNSEVSIFFSFEFYVNLIVRDPAGMFPFADVIITMIIIWAYQAEVLLHQHNCHLWQVFMCPDLFFRRVCTCPHSNHRSGDFKLTWVLHKEKVTVFHLERNSTGETNIEFESLNEACNPDNMRFAFNHFIYRSTVI